MASLHDDTPLVGIFVGGRGSRLGGVAKGNLVLEGGERVATRLVRTVTLALPDATVVLVGSAAAYAELKLRELADQPAGIGPLGGLRALLLEARAAGRGAALVLACDLPHVGEALLQRLAREAPDADFLAPRDGALWHTLVARYSVRALDAVDAAVASGERALQRVVARLGERAEELTVGEVERAELRDWDTPEDIEKSKGYQAPPSGGR
jgi:molybdopterin-guanine dinucleotide biosynthesis protein A